MLQRQGRCLGTVMHESQDLVNRVSRLMLTQVMGVCSAWQQSPALPVIEGVPRGVRNRVGDLLPAQTLPAYLYSSVCCVCMLYIIPALVFASVSKDPMPLTGCL